MRLDLLSPASCLAIVLTVSVAAANTSAATPLWPSPLRLGVQPAESIGTHLTLDAAALEPLRLSDPFVLTGFPLDATRTLELDLHRVEAFAPDAVLVVKADGGQRLVPRPDVLLLSGQVVGTGDSWAFLSFGPQGVNGLIDTCEGRFVLSSGPPGAARDPVIYNLTALPEGAIQIDPFVCAADQLPQLRKSASGGHATRGTPPCRIATVAVETDYEYRQLWGNDAGATAYAATLFGAISEIYTRDVNTRVQVGFLRLWSTPADPWTRGNTIDQLFEFQDYWNANMTNIERNAAHFLSGRGLGGGVAYLPGLCWPNYDYGLSANLAGFFPYPVQNNHSQNWDLMVVAHELGHNFGAPHTHEMTPPVDCCGGAYGGDCDGQQDCSVTPNGTIMSYCHLCPGGMTNVRMELHVRTVNEGILPYLDDPNTVARCDLELPPPAITDPPDNAAVCVGGPASFTVGADGGTLSYQWRHDGLDIPGATGPTYSIPAAVPDDAGSYDVVVSNECGSTVSSPATLTVCTPDNPADLDGDCTVGLADLAALLAHYGTTSGATHADGDVDGDGDVDLEDLAALLANYGDSC